MPSWPKFLPSHALGNIAGFVALMCVYHLAAKCENQKCPPAAFGEDGGLTYKFVSVPSPLQLGTEGNSQSGGSLAQGIGRSQCPHYMCQKLACAVRCTSSQLHWLWASAG